MTSSPIEPTAITARRVSFAGGMLNVDLSDGRTVSAPVEWFPRLMNGTDEERAEWRLIGDGNGIHWPRLDEDISVASILQGHRSGETDRSVQRWLDTRPSS